MTNSVTETRWLARRLDSLNLRRILAIAGTFGVIAGLCAYILKPPEYEATTTILTNDRAVQAPGSTALATLGIISGQEGSTLTRMEQIVLSRRLRNELSEKHDLAAHLGGQPQSSLSWLAKNTTVSPVGKGNMSLVGLAIKVSCPGPSRLQTWLHGPTPFTHEQARQLCADLANDYVVSLDKYLTMSSIQNAQENAAFIEKRLAEVRSNLDQTEDQLEQLQTEYALLDPDTRGGDLSVVARNLVVEHAAAVREIEVLEQSVAACRSRLDDEDVKRVAGESIARNPLISSLEQRRAKLLEERSSHLASGLQAAHPDIVAIDAALDEIDAELATTIQEIVQAVSVQPNPMHDSLLKDLADTEIKLAGARAREQMLRKQLDDANGDLRGLPPVARQYENISRQRQIEAEVVATLARELEIANIDVQKETSAAFVVLDEAVPPRRAAGTGAARTFAIAFIAVATLVGLAWGYRRGIFTDDPQGNPLSETAGPTASDTQQ